jgi:hypothetical protein
MGETDMPAFFALISGNSPNKADFMNPKNAQAQLKAWAKTDFSYFLKAGSINQPLTGGKECTIRLTGNHAGGVIMYGTVNELKNSLTDIYDRQVQAVENDGDDMLCINFHRFKPQILINIGPLRGWWGVGDTEDAGKPYKRRNFGDRTWNCMGFKSLIARGLDLMEKPPKDWIEVLGSGIGGRLGT